MRAAWEVYQLLEAGKRDEAADEARRRSRDAAAVADRARRARRARPRDRRSWRSTPPSRRAAASFKAGRHADVIAPLEAALVGEPAGARAASMHYYLGVAYAKADDARRRRSRTSQAAVDAEVDHEDARFQLASALDRSGQYARARAEYDRFATAHPQSSYAVFAMRRSAHARAHARGRAGVAPGGAPQPAQRRDRRTGADAAPPTIAPDAAAARARGAEAAAAPGRSRARTEARRPLRPTRRAEVARLSDDRVAASSAAADAGAVGAR